jgi:hypothetical protein
MANKFRVWTEEDLKLFKEKYPLENLKELSIILNRSRRALIVKAHQIGLIKELKEDENRPYLEKDIEFIKNNYYELGIRGIAKALNRSEGSIRSETMKLGIKSSRWWNESDTNYLKENFESGSKETICDHLHRGWNAIKAKAQELKLLRIKSNGGYYIACEIATQEEVSFISNNYNRLTVGEMATSIGRSMQLIETQCKKLGVKPFRKRKILEDYSNDILLDMLISLSQELGRSPMFSDVQSDPRFPSVDIYYDRFGSFTNALMLSDLSVDRIGSYGIRCVSENGEICDSYCEKIISDFLFYHKIEYRKNVHYYEIIPTINKRYRMDWLLEDGTFVEFFGLMNNEDYCIKTEKKIKICKDNNINLIGIYYNQIKNLNEIFKYYIN